MGCAEWGPNKRRGRIILVKAEWCLVDGGVVWVQDDVSISVRFRGENDGPGELGLSHVRHSADAIRRKYRYQGKAISALHKVVH